MPVSEDEGPKTTLRVEQCLTLCWLSSSLGGRKRLNALHSENLHKDRSDTIYHLTNLRRSILLDKQKTIWKFEHFFFVVAVPVTLKSFVMLAKKSIWTTFWRGILSWVFIFMKILIVKSPQISFLLLCHEMRLVILPKSIHSTNNTEESLQELWLWFEILNVKAQH